MAYHSGVIWTMCLLTGCRSLEVERRVSEPVFFPPLPEVPRLQFLTSFSGPEDLGARTAGGFERFLCRECLQNALARRWFEVLVVQGNTLESQGERGVPRGHGLLHRGPQPEPRLVRLFPGAPLDAADPLIEDHIDADCRAVAAEPFYRLAVEVQFVVDLHDLVEVNLEPQIGLRNLGVSAREQHAYAHRRQYPEEEAGVVGSGL